MDMEAQRTIRKCRKRTIILSAIGFALAYYSVYVSATKSKDPNYRALCDISEQVRCSKVFSSSFGKGLGVVGKVVGENSPLYQSNGVYGMGMYVAFTICSLFPFHFFAKLQVILGVIANIVSCYLAYILFIVLNDVCVVCIGTYIIGFLLLLNAIQNRRAVTVLRTEGAQNYTGYLDGKSTPGKKRI